MRLVVLASLLALGCAHIPPLSCPAAGGPTWVELTSPHFVLDSDEPMAVARAALADLEDTYAVFEHYARLTLPIRRAPPSERINVLLFARAEEVRALLLLPAGSHVIGRFLSGSRFAPEPTLLVAGRFETSTRETLQHELTHRFVRHYLPNAPVWLNEGLAEYQSTVQIGDGQVRFGVAPARCMLSERTENGGRSPDDIGRDLPSIVELIGADAERFHDPNREEVFYAAAWALVNVLESSLAYRPRLATFLGALGDGERADAAFARIFGDLPRGELDAAYRAQVIAGTPTSFWEGRYSPPPVGSFPSHMLGDAEVHLAWAKARPLTPDYFAAIEADLAESQKRQPDAPEVRVLAARLALERGTPETAEAELRPLADARPSDERCAMMLAGAVLDVEMARPAASRRRERLAEAAERVERVAGSPTARAMLAVLSVALGERLRAASFAQRAVDDAPDCVECLVTLAAIAFIDGAPADALALERAAAALVPDGGLGAAIRRDLERYARAARTSAKPSR